MQTWGVTWENEAWRPRDQGGENASLGQESEVLPLTGWPYHPCPHWASTSRYKMGTLIPTLLSFQKGHREGEEEVVSCTPWQVSSHWKDTPKVLPPSSGQDPELVRVLGTRFPETWADSPQHESPDWQLCSALSKAFRSQWGHSRLFLPPPSPSNSAPLPANTSLIIHPETQGHKLALATSSYIHSCSKAYQLCL